MRKLFILSPRPEYRGFITTVKRWTFQLSNEDFENLLVNEKTQVKQMTGVSLNRD